MQNRLSGGSTKVKGRAAGSAARVLLAAPLIGLMSVPALAGPTGEQVVHGSATFKRQGNHTVIRASNRAIINYTSFDLGKHESVRFIQPGAGSRVLNRIQSDAPTFIDGSIRANGQVYFVNRAGIVFGENAVLNVGGLYAAAGNISNRDFIAGNNHFTELSGDVINHGRIEAGEVGLIGQRVMNFGHIVAPEGVVTMASGDEVFIGERGGHVFARISAKDSNAEAGGLTQAGSIQAQQALLSVGDHFALAVLDTSSMQAERIAIRGGKNSTVTVSGDVVARDGRRGGQIDVFGDTIVIDDAMIDASGERGGGFIRIGGDYQGKGSAPTARRTLVTDSSLILADAQVAGHGGRVIVWADDLTGFGGFISARGGALGGDGGFVEVSGKHTLVYQGLADVRAVDGKAGQLLLDPRDINIIRSDDLTGTLTDISFFDTPPVTVTITDSKLAEQLSLLAGGATLTLQATRDITFQTNASVVVTDGGADGFGSLIVEAGRSVLFQAGVTIDMGEGSFSAFANATGFDPGAVPGGLARGGGTGFITMDATSQILTDGGSVLMQMDSGFNGDQTAGAITVSTIDAGSGTVTLLQNGIVGGGRHILQDGGGSGITAGQVQVVNNGAGRIGATTQSLIVNADTVAMFTDTAAIFAQIDGDATIGTVGGTTGISAGDANIAIVGDGDITLANDITAAATRRVTIRSEGLRTTGGVIRARDVGLEATSGSIGVVSDPILFSANNIAGVATAGIFMQGASLTGVADGVTVNTVDGIVGFTSTTNRIFLTSTEGLVINRAIDAATSVELDSAGELQLDQTVTAVDLIRINAPTVTGTNTLRAGEVAFNVGAGGIGTNGSRVEIETNFLAARSDGSAFINVASLDGASPVTIATVDGIDGIRLTAGDLKLISAQDLVLDRDIDVANDARIAGESITTSGGEVFATRAQLLANGANGTIGSLADALEVTASEVAASAGGSVFLSLNESVGGAGVEIDTFNVVAEALGGIVSTNGMISIASAHGLTIRSNVTATGHGLTTDVISISGPSLAIGAGAPTIDAGTGGILLTLDQLTVDAAMTGAFIGASATLDIGTGGLNAVADFGGAIADITIDVDGAFETAAAGRFAATNALSVTADSFTMAGGNSLSGTNELTVVSRGGLDATANLPAELDTTGVLTIRTLGGDLELLGNGAVFANATSVVLEASDALIFGGAAPTNYQFSALDATGGTGIEFGAGVEGLDAVGALSLDSGTGLINFLSVNPFTVGAGGGTTLLGNIDGAGDLTFTSTVDATGGAGDFEVTLDGVLTLTQGLDATGREIVLDTDGLVAGGPVLGLGMTIFADVFNLGNDRGDFHISNATLDNLTGIGALRLGSAANEATLVTIDGVATAYTGALTMDAVTVEASANDSTFAQLEMNVSDRLFVAGVRLEVTNADLVLEATNGIFTTDATLAASGVGNVIDVRSDITGTNNLTFAGDTLINGGGTRTITTDAGAMRFEGDVNAAAGESLVLDAGTGELRFVTGNIGRGVGGEFGSLDFSADTGIVGENSIAMSSLGGITLNNDLSTLAGDILIELDAAGADDGTALGSFQALTSNAGAGTAGIVVTSRTGDAGNLGLTFNGAILTAGAADNGITINAGDAGESSALGSITTAGGALDVRGLLRLGGDILTNAGDITVRNGLVATGVRSIDSAGGAINLLDTSVVNGDLTVLSNGGLITFGGAVIDQVPGSSSLTVDAGAGDVRFEDAIGMLAGIQQELALVDVMGARIVFQGGDYRAFTQTYTATNMDIDLAGNTEFRSLGGDMTFAGGTINLFNGSDLTLTSRVGGVVNVADVAVDAADADARLTADVFDTINFANLGTGGAALSVLDVTAGGGTGLINFAAATNAFADTFTLTGDHIQFGAGATGTGDVYTLTADRIDFGGANTIVGRDMTIVQRDGAFGIVLGGDGAEPAALNLTQAHLNALADGFDVIRIGNADTVSLGVLADAGGTPLAIRDPFELRTKGLLAIRRDIVGVDDAALALFADTEIVLNSTITLAGGNISGQTLAGAPVTVRLLDAVRLLTNGGDITLLGNIEGFDGVVDDSLEVQAGNGTVQLGLIGRGANRNLLDLLVRGRTISLTGIGSGGTAGVFGTTDVGATGVLTFTGDTYHTNEARYFASGGMVADQSLTFRTNEKDIAFGSAVGAGRGSITFGAGADEWLVDAGGSGTVFLDGVYTGTGVEMEIEASRVTLFRDTTINNAGGSLEIDAPISGRRVLDINMAGGDVRFTAPIGDQSVNALRLRDLTIDADTINFNLNRIDVDTMTFTADTYAFDLPVGPELALVATNGDIRFVGGTITFEDRGLTFIASRGEVVLTDIITLPGGAADSTLVVVRGRDGVTLGSIGTGDADGIESLLVAGNTMTVNGDLFVRGPALLRPFNNGRDIALGNAPAGPDTLVIDAALLARFRSADPDSSVNIGGFANPVDDSLIDPSNSLITIGDLAIANQLNVFGQGIEVLGGSVLTLNDQAGLRLRSSGETRVGGNIVGSGGLIDLAGGTLILDADILTGGGDLLLRDRASLAGAVLIDTRGTNDGIVEVLGGGIQGLAEGVGDLRLELGEGSLKVAAGGGIGNVTRLRSTDFRADDLPLASIFTTEDQTYTGTSALRLIGGELNSLSGSIRFNNDVQVFGQQIVTTAGNGRIFIDAIRGGQGAPANHSLTLRTAGTGAIEMTGDAVGINELVVDGLAELFGSRTFEGSRLLFLSDVESITGGADLVIRAGDIAQIGGNVGRTQATRFATLTVAADNGLSLGTSGQQVAINTSGQQVYENDVTIRGDVAMQSHGDGSGPLATDTVRFLGNIDGATAGADSLIVIVDRSTGFAPEGVIDQTALPENMPVIQFQGSIGQTTSLGRLLLNTDGAGIDGRVDGAGNPFSTIVATVVFGDTAAFVANGTTGSFTINADEFRMGRGESLTALGNISVNGTSAFIGDFTSVGNMDFSLSNELVVLNRPAGSTFDVLTQRVVDDEGTDLVAGGSITFRGGGTILVDGRRGETAPDGTLFNAVSLSSPGANIQFSGMNLGEQGDFQIRSLPSVSADLFVFNGQVLDLRAQGPGNTNVAEAIAGAAQTQEGGSIESGTAVPSTVREILIEIGLDPRGYAGDYPEDSYARQDVAQTMLGSLDGVGLFVDTANISGRGDQPEITLERLNRTSTELAVERYLLLWRGERDENGQLRTEIDPETGREKPVLSSKDAYIDNPADAPVAKIKAAFEQVADDCYDFLDQTNPEAVESGDVPVDLWLEFLANNEASYPAAATYLRELRGLVDALRAMGLSEGELRRIWRQSLSVLVPAGVSSDEFESMLLGDVTLEMARSGLRNGEAPVVDIEQ